MRELTIAGNEIGMLRVIAISRPVSEMAQALASRNKADIAADLLGQPVGEDDFELFAVSDLTGVGLPHYLIDGHGMAGAQVARDSARLDGLDGYVLLLLPNAFGGRDVTLPATPELTLIGTYAEEAAPPPEPRIDSEAAQPYSGVARQTPAMPPKGRAGSAMILLAIATLIALFVFWWLT